MQNKKTDSKTPWCRITPLITTEYFEVEGKLRPKQLHHGTLQQAVLCCLMFVAISTGRIVS